MQYLAIAGIQLLPPLLQLLVMSDYGNHEEESKRKIGLILIFVYAAHLYVGLRIRKKNPAFGCKPKIPLEYFETGANCKSDFELKVQESFNYSYT
jgi:hypothetical protein